MGLERWVCVQSFIGGGCSMFHGLIFEKLGYKGGSFETKRFVRTSNGRRERSKEMLPSSSIHGGVT